MKITAVEPLLIDRYLFVQVHTDAGLVGLIGEDQPPKSEIVSGAPQEPVVAWDTATTSAAATTIWAEFIWQSTPMCILMPPLSPPTSPRSWSELRRQA